MKRDLKRLIQSEQFRLRGIFIGTYIPRRCGIATYTKDLTNAVNVLNPRYLSEIMTLDDPKEPVDYPWEVKFRISKEDRANYVSAANYINRSSADYVSLQHEFGIFGGSYGNHILELTRRINKPLITTFHTTLDNPRPEQKLILKKIARRSQACVVMIKEAATRLQKIYGIPEEKIVVIPHGVPDIAFSPAQEFKRAIGFKKTDFIIGTINLVGPSKGLEYIIEAMPKILKVKKHAKFLMVGQTHPMVKLHQNENYRGHLRQLARKRRLDGHFMEVNEYVSLDLLISYLKALDVYITPYNDMGQTSSGTLAYAIGAGKVCIATPYIYAREVLDSDRGIIIPPQNADAIADAIIAVITNPNYRARLESNAYDFGRKMIWEKVAVDYLHLARLVLKNTT